MIQIHKPSGPLHIGLNWGARDRSSSSGTIKKVGVDLDIGCLILHEDHKLEYVYHGDAHQEILNFKIDASKDDTTGDMKGDDHLDNEIISIKTGKVLQNTQIVFFIDNCQAAPIGDIGHLDFRIYDGKPNKPLTTFVKTDLGDKDYLKEANGIVLGKLTFFEGEIQYYNYEIPVIFEGVENVKEAAAKTVDFI